MKKTNKVVDITKRIDEPIDKDKRTIYVIDDEPEAVLDGDEDYYNKPQPRVFYNVFDGFEHLLEEMRSDILFLITMEFIKLSVPFEGETEEEADDRAWGLVSMIADKYGIDYEEVQEFWDSMISQEGDEE